MSDTTISNEFPDSIAEHLRSIIADGTTQCPLCGCTSVHEHAPAEIVIYRNGVKYGRSLTDSGQQLATTERLLAESQAREKEAIRKMHECADAHVRFIQVDHPQALDAAIAKAKREVLVEAAEQIGIFEHGYECDEVLRRMADELKECKD